MTTHHKLKGDWYDQGFRNNAGRSRYLAIEIHDGKARIGETLHDKGPRVIFDAPSGEFGCEDFGAGWTFMADDGERERIEALHGSAVFGA